MSALTPHLALLQALPIPEEVVAVRADSTSRSHLSVIPFQKPTLIVGLNNSIPSHVLLNWLHSRNGAFKSKPPI